MMGNEEKGRRLQERLVSLEAQLSATCGELAALDPSADVSGTYLRLQVQGAAALLPSGVVQTVTRPVRFSPILEAPPHVLGSFSYRGHLAVAVELAVFLGFPKRPLSLDAHMVVIGNALPTALVVDEVRGLVEGLRLVPTLPSSSSPFPGSPEARGLIRALCQVGNEVIPLLQLTPLLATLPQLSGGAP